MRIQSERARTSELTIRQPVFTATVGNYWYVWLKGIHSLKQAQQLTTPLIIYHICIGTDCGLVKVQHFNCIRSVTDRQKHREWHTHNQSNTLAAVWHQLSASLSLYLSSHISIPFPLSCSLFLTFFSSLCCHSYWWLRVDPRVLPHCSVLSLVSIHPASYFVSPRSEMTWYLTSSSPIADFLFVSRIKKVAERQSNWSKIEAGDFVNNCKAQASQCGRGVQERLGYFCFWLQACGVPNGRFRRIYYHASSLNVFGARSNHDLRGSWEEARCLMNYHWKVCPTWPED